MNYEKLTTDKKKIIFDLAIKAMYLRPGLAGLCSGGEPSEKAANLAKHLAELIETGAVSEPAGF
jgi:hypothetical protein